ncbi:MAG: cation diffusion facilitator family transporter [Euryarchaeota archaeon]|nr:cation diffusion facilitator family transporter [Euryarchaeota archaeon]
MTTPKSKKRYFAWTALEKQKVAMLSIYSNSFLVVIKLIAGVLMGSISVISEGLHSMIDLLAAVIANYSIRKSAIPADKDHPYGHGKYENYAGVIEAVLILFAAIIIVYEASMRLIKNAPVEFLLVGIIIMGISSVVNFFVSRKLYKVGVETDSMALQADGLHLRTDVYTAMGVFIGLILIQLTGLEWLDPVVAILVAVLIVKAAWDLTREASKGLVDEHLPVDEESKIKCVLAQYSKSFVAFRALRTRKSGAERFVDLILVVKADMPVIEAHALCDKIEKEIEANLPNTNVLIHIEPCLMGDTCPHCRGELIEIVENPDLECDIILRK